jgi:hypothetical protein
MRGGVAFSQLTSPIVVDGILSDEKLAELLGWQTEYPALDYKRMIDPNSTAGLVELAKDIDAFEVLGGYIVVGVDNHGSPTGEMDGVDPRPFDEANLVPKLLRYLPEPLEVRTRVLERDSHAVVLIYVGRHPAGYAIFHTEGQYERNGKPVIVFRVGDAFWRDGTRSVRISQQGMEAIIDRRIADAKTAWLEEQQEIRRRDQAEIAAAYESRQVGDAPIGSVSFDLETLELTTAALEFIRRGNEKIPLIHLLKEAVSRARDAIDRDEIESELANLLDKLTCLAATFLEYEQHEWFERVIATLAQIYSMPLGEHDARRFGYATWIDPAEKAPRVWLLIIERVFGLGALAVRRGNWGAVRELTVQLPACLDSGYDTNWLRHALTMSTRAQHLQEQRGQDAVPISLLSLARNEVARLSCLRPDGLTPDDDAIITSLAQFDALSNITAIDDAGDARSRVFYSNFARFRQTRVQSIVERLLQDAEMRGTLFRRDDEDLATALAEIGKVASAEGVRYDGFDGWGRTPVGEFIERHLPDQAT